MGRAWQFKIALKIVRGALPLSKNINKIQWWPRANRISFILNCVAGQSNIWTQRTCILPAQSQYNNTTKQKTFEICIPGELEMIRSRNFFFQIRRSRVKRSILCTQMFNHIKLMKYENTCHKKFQIIKQTFRISHFPSQKSAFSIRKCSNAHFFYVCLWKWCISFRGFCISGVFPRPKKKKSFHCLTAQ